MTGGVFKPLKPIIASETDFAYLAGLVDGEGSIMDKPRWVVSVHKLKSGPKTYRYFKMNPTIGIYNSDKPVLTWIAQKFGGKIYITNRRGKKSDIPFRKTVWQVVFLTRAQVVELCRRMLPYLRIKRVKAQRILRRYG